MDIQIKRCADIGMAHEHSDSLIVAFTLDTSCGESVTEAMKLEFRQI